MGVRVKSEKAKRKSEELLICRLAEKPRTSEGSVQNAEIDEATRPEDKYRSHFIRRFCSLISFALCLFTFHFFTGCEESFEPLQENERYHFSIYGYLDASADTQWVRVSPARQEFDMPDEIPEMNVTLENLESGETAVMKDSLVHFGQGFNVLNVWTKMDVEPGQSYILHAETPGESASRVTITLPDEFPTPRVLTIENQHLELEYYLQIDGVERLVDVHSRWYIRIHTPSWEEQRMVQLSLKQDVEATSSGSYLVQLFPDQELEEVKSDLFIPTNPDTEIEVLHHQLYVAAGGPEWDDDITSMDELVYSAPDGFSNVEDGLGYMVGIISTLIPFESCYDGNVPIACPEEKPLW